MAHRTFRDSTGTEWQVWDVAPHVLQGTTDRRTRVRRQAPAQPHDPERRELEERRTGKDRRGRRRLVLTPGMEQGWLVFESTSEKRRMAPIPDGWDTQPEPDLERLCGQAHPVPKRTT